MFNEKLKFLVKNKNLHILFILTFGFILFYPSLNSYFVGDNLNQIFNIKDGFIGQSYGYVRPLSVFTVWLDKLIWTANSFGYHLTNLLLHLSSTIMVYIVSSLIFNNRFFQFTAALLFLLHPIHSMSLFWISGRSDMLCALFYLLSFYYFLKYYQEKRISCYILHVLFFIFSLLSKEMAVSLPILIFAYILIFNENIFKTKLYKALQIISPLLLIFFTFIAARFFLLPGQEFYNLVHSNIAIPHLVKNMTAFIGLLLIPGGHIEIAAFLRAHPVFFLIMAILSFGIGTFLFWKLRKSKTILFLLIFILVSILPVIRLVMRWYLYIPSIGFCMLLSFLIVQISESIKYKQHFRNIVLILVSIVFFVFIKTEQTQYANNGQFSKKLSHQISNVLIEQDIKEIIFLNNIAEIRETPVLIFGLSSFVNFAANQSFDKPDIFTIHSITDISLSDNAAIEKIMVTKTDSNVYVLKIDDDTSVFDFPMDSELISQQKQLIEGLKIKNEFGKIIINKLNKQMKAREITFKLKEDNNLPVMYYSKGQLHIVQPG